MTKLLVATFAGQWGCEKSFAILACGRWISSVSREEGGFDIRGSGGTFGLYGNEKRWRWPGMGVV